MARERALAFLLTPRWLALTLACLLALPAFKELSDWQWRRLHQRQAFNASVERNLAGPPIDVSEVLSDARVDSALQWRTVRGCGTWDTAHQVLVRRKSLDASAGFWVVTPLTGSGVDFPVLRGWIAAGGSSKDSPDVPTPPGGTVCVTARLRLAPVRTAPEPKDLPTGQVDRLAPGAYGEMVTSSPDSSNGLVLWPAPELTEGPHRSYALQWLIFAVMTVIGWVILVRGEVRARLTRD